MTTQLNVSVEFLLLAVFQVWRAAMLAGQSEDRNLTLWAGPVPETGRDLHFHRLPSRGQWRCGTRLSPVSVATSHKLAKKI